MDANSLEDPSVEAAQKRRARFAATVVVGAGCAALSAIGFGDRLNFTVPSSIEFLAVAANQPIWSWMFAAVSLAVATSLLYDRWHVPALAAATGTIGAWSFLNLLWGLNSVRPVSLAGPVLGSIVAALAYLLAMLWARSDEHAKGR